MVKLSKSGRLSKKIIISIDGGGIRGIIPLVMLRRLQMMTQKNLFSKIDSWYGTSTGALISAGLLAQKKSDFLDAVQNVLDIYEFRSTSSVNPLSDKNPQRAFYKILEENFDHLSFEDLPELNVIAHNVSKKLPEIFNKNNPCSLTDALKASCAVPGIFKSILIKGENYIDGFISAKNPAEIALKNESTSTPLILISLGSGILRETDEIENQVKAVHEKLHAQNNESNLSYYRLNPRLKEGADDMRDTRLKNLFGLKKDAENFILEKEEMFEKLIEDISKS